MCDELARLAGEQEVFGGLLLSLSQCVRGGKMLEGVVDFDRAQVASIEREELFAGHS